MDPALGVPYEMLAKFWVSGTSRGMHVPRAGGWCRDCQNDNKKPSDNNRLANSPFEKRESRAEDVSFHKEGAITYKEARKTLQCRKTRRLNDSTILSIPKALAAR